VDRSPADTFPDAPDGSGLRFEDLRVGLPLWSGRAAEEERPGEVGAIEVEPRSHVDQYVVSSPEAPFARRMMRKGGVLAEGDDALERGGVCAPLDHVIVYLRLEGPLRHLLLHERRDVVDHRRDDSRGVRDRLQ